MASQSVCIGWMLYKDDQYYYLNLHDWHDSKCTSVLTLEKFEVDLTMDKFTDVEKRNTENKE